MITTIFVTSFILIVLIVARASRNAHDMKDENDDIYNGLT